MSVSKSFNGYSRNIFKITKMFLLQKLFGLVKFLILVVFCELYWNHSSFSFEKFCIDAWQLAKKKIKNSTTLLSMHNMIIINIIFFSLVINTSVCFAERKMFVVAFILDIMQFDHMLQFFLNCSYRYTSLPVKLIESSPIAKH